MTIYNTIKNLGKEMKYAALGGLAALVIGCAPANQAAIDAPFPNEETAKVTRVIQEAPEISRLNAYFRPRVGGIWAHGEKSDGTDYPKGSLTAGFEAEVSARNGGVGARLTLDSFKSKTSDTVNGTDYSIKNDSLIVGADLIYPANRTSRVKPYAGLGICSLSENSEARISAPYNEHETSSSNTTGYRGIVGVKMEKGRCSAHVEAGVTSYPSSENVKTTSSLTAGIGLNF